jgi:hypothetical protein
VSEENVEVVRRFYGEWPEASELPEWVAGFWESDGDYYPVRGFPEARPCHGHEEIAAFLAELREPWDHRIVVKDARAIGDDRVFVRARMWAEGARAAQPGKASSTSAAGSGMDDSSGSRII